MMMFLPKWAAKERDKEVKALTRRYFQKYGRPKKGKLAPAEEFTPPLGHILNPGDEDGYLAQLMLRGHEEEDIINAVREVIRLMKRQNFTVGEVMMFLRFVEQISLSSPLKA